MHDKINCDFIVKSNIGIGASLVFGGGYSWCLSSSGQCLAEGTGAPGKGFENQQGSPLLYRGVVSHWQEEHPPISRVQQQNTADVQK